MELLQILVRCLAGSIDNCFLQTALPTNEVFSIRSHSLSLRVKAYSKQIKSFFYLLQVSSLFLVEKSP